MRSIFLALAFVAGCDPGDPPIGEPVGHDESKIQVTVWGDRFEAFVEHEIVVVGIPTAFITHVTDLKSFQPHREGRVTFALRQGAGPPLEHVEEAPQRPGIYAPELRFPKAGVWSLSLRIPSEGAESVVDLPPLTAYASPEEARKTPAPKAPEGVSFLKEQQWKVLTKTEPVGRRRMVERVRLPAVVTARPGSRAAVAPPVAGRLLLAGGKSVPSLGDAVERGQTLALIQPPFSDFAAKVVAAEADVIQTRLAVAQAELTHTRVKKLAAEQAKSEREAREAEFALNTARADHEAAAALKAAYEKSGAVFLDDGQARLPVFELKAPIAGVVVQVSAAVGEHVPADRAVFTILDAGTVFIEARIPEADVGRIASSTSALYETPDAKGRFTPIPGENGGRLILLGPEVDPGSRTVPLIYELKNSERRLRVGMALTLYAETARAEETLAIPVSAIVEEDARPIAFVQVAGEMFEKRDLQVGIRDAGFVQILQGLSEGERVVVQGAFAVRLASVSTTIPAHGHAH